MARYFFHLCDGSDTLIDPDGREIADISLVSGIALKEARAIIGQDAASGSIELGQRIEVRNDADVMVYRLAFRDAVSIHE